MSPLVSILTQARSVSQIKHTLLTQTDCYIQIHAFWAFIPALSASTKAMIDIMRGFGWLLGVDAVDETKIVAAMETAASG